MTWMEVPDRALVAVHSASRDATWFAYRYGSRGRWLYHDKIWDPGRLCWRWEQMHEDARCGDYVVIDIVSPNQTVEWFADKCKTPCGSHGGRAALSAIEFERGNRIAWDDVRTGSVVQIQSGAVAYRHSDGTGSWARCPPSETSTLREAGVQWPWRHLHHGGWEWAKVKSRIGRRPADQIVRAANPRCHHGANARTDYDDFHLRSTIRSSS